MRAIDRSEPPAARLSDVWFQPLTPLSFLERSRRVFPDKTAVVYGQQRLTYAEFAARVHRLASALLRAGLRKDDRVAVLCPNIPPILEAHFGVPLAGGILVPINYRLAADEIAYILEHSGARFLLVDTEFSRQIDPADPRLRQLGQIVSIVDAGPGPALPGPTYEAFLATGSPEPSTAGPADENDTIAINYTSGTTGRPKGVMYTHRGAYLNALGDVIHARLGGDAVYLWVVPMFHCNGWGFTWAVTAVGGLHVCLRKVDPAVVWGLLEREAVSHLCGAPTVLTALVNHPAGPRVSSSRRVTAVTGGAPPSPTLLDQLAALGIEVVHVYGLTETYAPFTLCEAQAAWPAQPAVEQARLRARQGVPYVVSGAVRVVDSDMRDVPADGVSLGEVVMRGNTVTSGYYRQPEATAEAFRGGWFHSGDLGVMHPDGYVELRDRAKDIIISGGENISSIEVERTIVQHPAVLEAAVIAIPDPTWGEVPKAFVTLKTGSQASAEEIIAFCRGRIARFKCPKAIEFGELPKTSTGKIQKYALRERAWEGMDRRIN
jgi:fatty-acyl-CoA synthase